MAAVTSNSVPSKQEVVDWLIDWIAKELQMPHEEIDIAHSLLDYSLSSVTATILVGDLEDWLDLRLPPTLAWDYPSIEAITDFVWDMAKEKAPTVSQTDAGEIQPDLTISKALAKDPNKLLERLDQLSDEEVDALFRQLSLSE